MSKLVYQFRITLKVIDPPVWRVIRIPKEYTFWDLHVAIQDAMGWMDYHLHEFRKGARPEPATPRIGIPIEGEDDFFPNSPLLPGWQISIDEYFHEPGMKMYYEYDFGDGWLHEVLLEGVLLREKGVKYPNCIAGGRTTPPEDCGGPHGYYSMLETLADAASEDYKETLTWLRHHVKNYLPYEPNAFDIGKIRFTSAARRLNRLLKE
ncbi:plasmid pRiA4b ORF-3 family protein [Chlorobium limicola]|uniref:Plasmid pRiA4b Orf3-like domain-containing protein n=1 Tax=Chlorobium limicola TaxID=1092 RepID=A0A117MP18_CHLLI|nr:plasmid pRiA4b ORF-3 family protein [Chlorobium limicola]KUL27924.1 hypothetical protein ASB62_05955 [Chlorobium limicola]